MTALVLRTTGLSILCLLVSCTCLEAAEFTMVQQRDGTRLVLTLDARVAAQQAIEEVYWRHRIWPQDNPDPKPPRASVISDEAIRHKVEEVQRKSSALELWWKRGIEGDQLRAEVERMVRDTQDPTTLRELFAALNDDPVLIAEALARPLLVERQLRNWFAFDARFHEETRQVAEAALAAVGDDATSTRSLGGHYVERVIARDGMYLATGAQPNELERVEFDDASYSSVVEGVARRFGTPPEEVPLGRLSALQEDAETFHVTAVLAVEDDRMTVATVSWPKRSVDLWWQEQREQIHVPFVGVATAAAFPLTLPTEAPCERDTWDNRQYLPAPRTGHTAVWTGTEMIVWGGDDLTWIPVEGALATGGRYDPATDTWRPTSIGPGTPLRRLRHTAVWTGTKMIVWGGATSGENWETLLNTGAVYDPLHDGWTPTSTGAGVPLARSGHTAVWTGREMIIWGGLVPANSAGARYDPRTDTWTPITQEPTIPILTYGHTAMWTGEEMIVWGGHESAPWNFPWPPIGGRYNPRTDSWKPTQVDGQTPLGREGHVAVWTGREMIVWGGFRQRGLTSGGRYDPALDRWTPIATPPDGPVSTPNSVAVWAGKEMIVWGGNRISPRNTGWRYSPGTDSRFIRTNTGARYDLAVDAWSPTSAGAAVPAARGGHSAVWTGTEVIVWGGATDSSVGSSTGARYSPLTDDWIATSTGDNVPEGTSGHSAVWTGNEMIVFGGNGSATTRFSGRYDPATDGWSALSEGSNAPKRRYDHAALWTGTEMIIWGGHQVESGTYAVNTGARYRPATDEWFTTSLGESVPTPRRHPLAAWTGDVALICGGREEWSPLIEGGKYDPADDAWRTIPFNVATISGAGGQSAIWTGRELVVWGAAVSTSASATGAAFDPLGGTWTNLSIAGTVTPVRIYHRAVWTGSKMLVFGGIPYVNDLGIYCRSTDATPAAAAPRRPTLSGGTALTPRRSR